MKKILFLLLVILLLTLPASAQADPDTNGGSVTPVGWIIERVDAPRLYTELTPSMFQYANNTAYIAFGGDHLYYAFESGSYWSIETVDPAWGVGRNASLALRSTDHGAIISYYDATNRTLKLAKQIFSAPGVYTWQISILDTGADGCTSIDLKSDNLPAIAYQKNSNLYFKEYTCSGTTCTWSAAQRIDSAPDTGEECGLAFDSNNRPHIAYSDESNNDLKYAFYNGTAWTLTTVDSSYQSGLSLAVDSSNHPHIAYSGSGFKLYYAFLNHSTWEITKVDDTSTLQTSISLYQNRYDSPHIAYNTADGSKYAHLDEANANCTASGWACNVTNPSEIPVYLSLHMITENSNPAARLVYHDLNSLDMKYIDDTDSSQWFGRSLNFTSAHPTKGVSLAFTDYDPVISYVDSSSRILKYAKRDGSKGGPTCGSDSTGWICQNTSFDADFNTSLAVDYYYDQPNILFEHKSPYGLHLTHFNGATWDTPSTISTNNIKSLDQKLICSFVGSDYVCNTHIAFFDENTDSVIYAHTVESAGNCGGGSWQCETVENSLGSSDGGTDLEMDPSGKPAVSYYNVATGQVRIAYRVGNLTGTGCNTGNGNWDCDTVETVGNITPVTALAFTESNTAILAYYSENASAIRYAYNTTPRGAFTSQNIYLVTNSRDLDLVAREGLIAIAFYDYDQKNLVLARLVYDHQGNCGLSGNFQCDIIDSAGDVGSTLDLALSPSNLLYIAYGDDTNGDLKLAWQAIQVYLPAITR